MAPSAYQGLRFAQLHCQNFRIWIQLWYNPDFINLFSNIKKHFRCQYEAPTEGRGVIVNGGPSIVPGCVVRYLIKRPYHNKASVSDQRQKESSFYSALKYGGKR